MGKQSVPLEQARCGPVDNEMVLCSKWKGRGLVVGSANGDTCSASERHAVPAHPGAHRHCMEVEKGVEAPYLGESRHSGPARPRLADW
ncbi:hypothetical protein MHYP_G00139300 [Metynnis hypsauchen]